MAIKCHMYIIYLKTYIAISGYFLYKSTWCHFTLLNTPLKKKKKPSQKASCAVCFLVIKQHMVHIKYE